MNLRLQWDVEKDLLKDFLRSAEPFLRQSFELDDEGFDKMVATVDRLPDVVTFDATGKTGLQNLLSFGFFAGAPRLFIEAQKMLVRLEEDGEFPVGDKFRGLISEVITNSLANVISSGRVFDRERVADEGDGRQEQKTEG